MKRGIVLGFVVTLLLALTSACLSSALAKNMHLPPDAERIIYYTGGQAEIDLPSGLPDYPTWAKKIQIFGVHIEEGSHGGGDSIVIELYSSATEMWRTTAHITTKPDSVTFLQEFWRGTNVVPPPPSPDNVIDVLDSDLTVERHGNRITVRLETSQELHRYVSTPPSFVSFILPAFKMELDKFSGSIREEINAGYASGRERVGPDLTTNGKYSQFST